MRVVRARQLILVCSRAAARRRRDEQGVVAIIVALLVSMLAVIIGMVLDFGLVQVDRQVDKSAADAATDAGLHALNAGDGHPHPFIGVCTALRFLQSNSRRFSGISDTTGSWKTGTGAAAPDGCTNVVARGQLCTPGSKSSWARFVWTGSLAGKPLTVTIQSGYQLSSTSGWSEDTLAVSTADQNDTAQGCDQLAVTISESRAPGLGSLATSSDLKTAVRTVGRVSSGPGGFAPAMLLLKWSGCNILTAGSSAGGSKIKVVGVRSAANGLSQPGTIHSDSNGSGCGSNENIFTGQAGGGIMAYAAPLVSGAADPTKPGLITAYAASPTVGKSGTVLRDLDSNVCGTLDVYPAGICPGATVAGRERVYREPIDQRYLGAVTTMRNNANSAFSVATSWPIRINDCNPTQAQVNALNLTSASQLYVNCNANNGFNNSANLTISAGTIVFSGSVKPSATLKLPNATHVYVAGASGDAIALSNGGTFSMHSGLSDANLSSGLCSDLATGGPNKAVLVVKNGDVKQTGGTLQMCYTTVLMMGGQTDACLSPLLADGTSALSKSAPNPTTPCGGGTGNGQFTQTGGDVDWTAPNRYDATLRPDGSADPTKSGEWADPNGPEDLGLWSESGGGSSNPKYQMTGGGAVHLRGVLMAPNAEPFNLSGQFNQTLVNAQYIVSSISLSSNNTSITLKVDPNAAVTLPKLKVVGLVR
jgi:Flp pilus assembly protein TadG